MELAQGVGVALVTPFTTTGRLDLIATQKLVEHVITGGVDYLVPLGTTGEAVTLSEEEQDVFLIEVLTNNAGKLPIFLGCGGNDTAKVVKRIFYFQERFAIQGFLCVSPYYNKPSQQGIYNHYRELSETSMLPIILYNVPPRTGSNVLPDTVLRIANDCKNIIAIKEASANLEQAMHILKDKSTDFQVLSGDDALALPGIACGCTGVISVVANIVPKPFTDLIHKAMAGDFAGAREIQWQILHLIELLFKEGNPAGIKAALAATKICEQNLRSPLAPVSKELFQQLDNELKRLNE